jgi:hypothetical protein
MYRNVYVRPPATVARDRFGDSPTMVEIATTPRPPWAVELTGALDRPYPPEELAHIRRWTAGVRRLRAEEPTPAGAFQRLPDLGRAEDGEPDD